MNARTEVRRAHALVEHAGGYANMGLKVFPLYGVVGGTCTCHDQNCKHPGAHPRFSDGVSRASRYTTRVATGFFQKMRDVNLGIATGAGSRIFALCVDSANGGKESMDKLVTRQGALPETFTAVTKQGCK